VYSFAFAVTGHGAADWKVAVRRRPRSRYAQPYVNPGIPPPIGQLSRRPLRCVDADQACAGAPVSRSVASAGGRSCRVRVDRASSRARCRNDVNLGGEEEIAVPDPFLASFNGFCTSRGRHWRKPGSPVPSKLGYHLFVVGSGAGWQEAKMVQALTQDGPIHPVLGSPKRSIFRPPFAWSGIFICQMSCRWWNNTSSSNNPFPSSRLSAGKRDGARLEQDQRQDMVETIILEMPRLWWHHGPLGALSDRAPRQTFRVAMSGLGATATRGPPGR
jgi:hypothetical protein